MITNYLFLSKYLKSLLANINLTINDISNIITNTGINNFNVTVYRQEFSELSEYIYSSRNVNEFSI